ncbi:MAG: DEAD/DEAH box helicase, partial [Chlamydiae bacterium]|nr:DEAD/DEAH box helicase [Chlamydiota bacterium]
MRETPFSPGDSTLGESLRKQGCVKNIFFSEGTYQIECVDGTSSETFWPFLQLDDRGKILDCFCTCHAAESKGSCEHLAAAFLTIFNDKVEPLHRRFRESLWNVLCQLAARRHGYESHAITKEKEGLYQACSQTGKVLLQLKPLTKTAEEQLEEIIAHRHLETEETSLKFSNLSSEELLLWKQGRPTTQLQFELSFWSDLAKWWMFLQEKSDPYSIDFIFDEKGFPKGITIAFSSLKIAFYVAEVNWAQIIPTLKTVASPLPVFDVQGKKVKQIEYDPEKRQFTLDWETLPKTKPSPLKEGHNKTFTLDSWVYEVGVGFYPAKPDHFLENHVITEEKIPAFLQKYLPLLKEHLTNTKVSASSIVPRYKLYFTPDATLHIDMYLFEEEDLQKGNPAYFSSWVYLDGRGFYHLEESLFPSSQMQIPKEDVAEFIDKHRFWLHTCDGFQPHVSSVEARLGYHVDERGNLHFTTLLDVEQDSAGIMDFGSWIYIKGRGFYAKASSRTGMYIKPGLVVPRSDLSRFIRKHREDLETLRNFFTPVCHITKAGVTIVINEEGVIVVKPEYSFLPQYPREKVRIFEEYTFVENEGFAEIPFSLRLPDLYQNEKEIDADFEPYFLAYDLTILQPFTVFLDPRLQKTEDLSLQIKKAWREDSKNFWRVEMEYQTEIGSILAYDIWEAIHDNKKYLFSKAGLIYLKQSRFHWLKGLSKKRWAKNGKEVRLTTIEWIRLSVFENIKKPAEQELSGESSDEMRSFLNLSLAFVQGEIPEVEGLHSSLRPYQEMGLRWLWFLYSNGLSGLLCDEMGLGKTHQAMALIAALRTELRKKEKKSKVLVVCPTSVIFHWQELLKRFLPSLQVYVFYGAQRNLEDVTSELVLTSYGILRTEKQALSKIPFELAVFDEVQIAKNAKSQTHKALRGIDANMRLGLTGTPIENELLELKALFDVILPTYLPNESVFKELFVNPIEKGADPEKKFLLSRLVKPFLLRRKKTEVLLELPEKTEEIAYCVLSDEQKKMYDETMASSRSNLLDSLKDRGSSVPYLHVFALLTSLKRICDHPCLIHKNVKEYKKHHSGKWELFVELLKEARESKQKVVVFSQYLEMLDIIEAYLKEEQIGFAGIRGSTRNRAEQVATFANNPSCEVFVASLQAAGVGIDLVAASVVIHYDRWWNPAKENQATDRVHRIGQNRGVQVFKMVTKNTIEESIHQIIERKKGLLEGVIGYDDQEQVKSFTREELIQLLEIAQ